MVKNEMSLHVQQSYNMALKISENEIKSVKNKTIISIKALNEKVSIKSVKGETNLLLKRKEHLDENVKGLFLKNSHDAKAIVLKNAAQLHRLNWSYVHIARNTLSKEEIRKIMSINRHNTAIYDINYSEEKFIAKWDNIFKENEINYKLELNRLLDELYSENPIIPYYNKISYIDFYNETVNKYNALKKKASDDLSTIYPLIIKVIDETAKKSYALQTRQRINDIKKELIAYYEDNEKLLIDNIYKKVDLKTLNEQKKDKIDVDEEYNEICKEISDNDNKILLNNNHIAKLTGELNENIAIINASKNADYEISVVVEDEKQMQLLKDVVACFKLPNNEVFNRIYQLIKDYVLAICPFFYDFLKVQEDEYEKENEEYRKGIIKTLPKEKALAFKDFDSYVKFIHSPENTSSTIDELKIEHENKLKALKEELHADYATIKSDKAKRKELYLEQKVSAKQALKIADGNKASEIKEVLKLYKKEINANQLKTYLKAYKNNKKKINQEKQDYQTKVIGVSHPKPLSYRFNHSLEIKKLLEEEKKEKRDLARENNKDFKTSKFRRNSSTTTRENKLGYLFLSIWAIGFLVFTLYPIFYSLLMLVSNVTYDINKSGYGKLIDFNFKDGLTFPNYVGSSNFDILFLKDVYFPKYLLQFFQNLLFFVPIVVFIAFVLAMLLNSKIKGRTLFRIIYFLPVVIISGPLIKMFFESGDGSSIKISLDGTSISKILQSFSTKAYSYAKNVFSNFVIILWMTGVPIVLFISALQKINRQLYEAAEIDGANKWQMLWAITFPLIKSIMLIVCLFTIMQVSTIDIGSINPINSWINVILSDSGSKNLGLASLGAWCQTVIVLLFVLVSFLLFREKEFVSKTKNFEEMEKEKKRKQARKAKAIEFFHINEINKGLNTIFAPLIKFVNVRKEKKEKKEMEG